MLRHWDNSEGYLDAEAEQDRLEIWEYIVADNPPAAVRMDELFSAAASLKVFSDKGRLGQIAGTRELIPHENYRLVYQTEDTVWILPLVHAARM